MWPALIHPTHRPKLCIIRRRQPFDTVAPTDCELCCAHLATGDQVTAAGRNPCTLEPLL